MNTQQLLRICTSYYEYAAVSMNTHCHHSSDEHAPVKSHYRATRPPLMMMANAHSQWIPVYKAFHRIPISSTVKLSKIGADFWQFHSCRYGRSPHESDPDCVNYMSRTRYVRDRYITYFYCNRTEILTVTFGFRPYGFHTVSVVMCTQSSVQGPDTYFDCIYFDCKLLWVRDI